jgi:hypothetical protein
VPKALFSLKHPSTKRTSGHCLGTLKTAEKEYFLPLPFKCSVNRYLPHCLPSQSLFFSVYKELNHLFVDPDLEVGVAPSETAQPPDIPHVMGLWEAKLHRDLCRRLVLLQQQQIATG